MALIAGKVIFWLYHDKNADFSHFFVKKNLSLQDF